MLSRLKTRHFIGLAVIGLLMTYQNCAQAPENTSDAKSYAENLPFAYSAKVDTLAYMSCSELKSAVEPRAYFSYRAGAYNTTTGGLALTDKYRTATQYFDASQRGNALGDSSLNANTRLNLSVRSRSNLQSIWYQGTVRLGYEIESFLPPLSGAQVAGPLGGSAAGRMLNYFPSADDKRLMEASVRMYEYDNLAREVRNNLEGSGTPSYLVVGYSQAADELNTGLRVPASPVVGTVLTPAMAYGTGYSFSFSVPSSFGFSSAERRVISPINGVTEVDLASGQQMASTWDCNQSFQFMIVRPEDRGTYPCAATPDPSPTTYPQINAIRRVLRVEDWYVDVSRRCVVPKRTGDYCYGAIQAGQAIQYTGAACSYSGAALCPHFVSVCIRR